MASNDAGTKVSQNVPVWLSKTFVDAVRGCGSPATPEQIDAKAQSLLDYWCASTRPYHNAGYLARVIAAIDELSEVSHSPDLLRAAIWYIGMIPPDAILLDSPEPSKFRDSCPERISESLQSLGVDHEVAGRACDLLSCVARHVAPLADVDASALVDASMCDLASTPQEYKKYRQALREEYSHLSTLQYQIARRRYIKTLLGRPSIYFSPGAADWEPLARQNLEAELANIEASIRKVDPSILDDEDAARTVAQDTPPPATSLIIKKVGAKPDNERTADKELLKPQAESARSAVNKDVAESAPQRLEPAGETDRPSPLTTPDSALTADSALAKDSARPADYELDADSAPSAPSPARSPLDIPMTDDSGASTLEAEPEFLAPLPKEPAHRMTAKEQAREAARKAKAEKAKAEQAGTTGSGTPATTETTKDEPRTGSGRPGDSEKDGPEPRTTSARPAKIETDKISDPSTGDPSRE
ncbi:MAG: hypothetical protein QM234_02450 [Acidobacteriota bacterium]|nr:hypothetical protein [Acidobacteriota bacterium]